MILNGDGNSDAVQSRPFGALALLAGQQHAPPAESGGY